jgi:catechol 2,3-dioxygenase-like lactoylglutathione lyase family enzyme
MTNITGTDFITVATKDIDAAVEFYGGTLGLPELKRYGQMPGVEFETGNLTVAVLQSEAFGMTFGTNGNPIAFQVEDVEAARKDLEAKGVEFAADTLDSGVCHMAFFHDPDGNALMLHHRYAPKDARPAAAQ